MAVLGATTLTGCNSIPSFISSGSKMIFNMATSPTSWTKDTSPTQIMLRVVSGTASPGGSLTFPQVFASRSYSLSSTQNNPEQFFTLGTGTPFSVTMPGTAYSGTIGLQPATLSVAQIRLHAHPYLLGAPAGSETRAAVPAGTGLSALSTSSATTLNTSPVGTNGSHAHAWDARHTHPFPSINPHTHNSVPLSPHSHPVGPTGTISGFSLTYVDVIISSKN